MTLLHTMSLAGSIAVTIYLLSYFLTKRYLPVLWHKVYLTMNIVLFIMPFGLYKREYARWLNKILGLETWFQKKNVIKNVSSFTVSVYENSIYVSNVLLYVFLIAGVLLSVVAMLLFLKNYITVYSKIMRGIAEFTGAEEVLDELNGTAGAHTRSRVYLCTEIKTPLTIGIIHKKIILPDVAWEENRLKDVLRHELVHINVWDNFVKFILYVVVIINFYNPLVYYLLYQWNLTAEMYCDDKVTANKSVQERKNYARLIIDFAEKKGNAGLPVTGLSMGERQLKERIENMKNTGRKYGKISKVAGVFVIAAAVLASSLTAFAYEKQQVNYFDEEGDGNNKEIFYFNNGQNLFCTEQDVEYDLYEQYISSEDITIFIDKTGEVYYDVNIEEGENQTYRACSHTYESGTIAVHSKNSSGGCTVKYYNAQLCKECGNIVYGDLAKTVIYPVCPH